MKNVLKCFSYIEWLLFAACGLVVIGEVYIELKIPEFVSAMTSLMTAGAPIKDVAINGAFMLACAFGAAACLLIVGFLSAFLGARIARNIRERIYEKVMRFSLEDVDRFSTATLITRSTNDVNQIQMIFSMGAQYLFRAPVLSVWAVVKVLQNSWEWSALTGGAVAALILCSVVIILYALPKFKKIQLLIDDVNRIMREQLTGVRVVRAYNAEKYSESKFAVTNDELTRTNISVNRALITINPIMNIIMSGASIGVFWIGGALISATGDGAMRLALFSSTMSMTMYVTQVLSGFLMLVMCFVLTPRALVAAGRVSEILEVVPSVRDPENPVTPTEADGAIEFCDVSFRYPGANEDVLKHISFKAERGETVAFIGSTGSGKTTLVNLVPRFYDVTGGCVKVDGVDIRDYAQSDLRKKIGYVPQRAMLFSGDLYDNINFGTGADGRDETDVAEALETAQASEFVSEMDGELHALIAQGGTNVSGGQRQRLAIARAVCRKPEIYIFDDSFSALDFKTDKKLRAALAEKTGNATKLIVAQRVGTIMDADRIIVLDNGEAVGIGTHAELLQNCKVYREIALSQFSKEELE